MSVRERITGASRAEYVKEFNAELEAHRRSEIDADPIIQFQKSANAEGESTRELLLTGYVPDSLFPGGLERIAGRVIANEGAAIRNFQWFAQHTSTFKHWMARQLLDAAERSDLAPIAPNYTALHNLILEYSAYEEPVQSEQLDSTELVLSPSEQDAKNRADLDKIIGVVDGVEITERYLNFLPSRDELLIRRKMEKGHAGSSVYDAHLLLRDAQHARDLKTARIAAAEMMEEK
jgi:hypothetical protein